MKTPKKSVYTGLPLFETGCFIKLSIYGGMQLNFNETLLGHFGRVFWNTVLLCYPRFLGVTEKDLQLLNKGFSQGEAL